MKVVRQNVTGLQWIASEAWTIAIVLHTPRLMPYVGGTLGIAIRRGEIPALKEFLLSLRPDKHPSNQYGQSMAKIYFIFFRRKKTFKLQLVFTASL